MFSFNHLDIRKERSIYVGWSYHKGKQYKVKQFINLVKKYNTFWKLLVSGTVLASGKTKMNRNDAYLRTSLVTQWLRLRAPNAGGPGSIPGQGNRSHMHAATKTSATTQEPSSRN